MNIIVSGININNEDKFYEILNYHGFKNMATIETMTSYVVKCVDEEDSGLLHHLLENDFGVSRH